MATMREYLNNSFKNQAEARVQETSKSNCHIPYKLFVYREELRRLNKHVFKLFKSKLNLTRELVSYSVEHIAEYNMDELININEGITLTRRLKWHLDDMKRMQKAQLKQIELQAKVKK